MVYRQKEKKEEETEDPAVIEVVPSKDDEKAPPK